MHTFVSHRSLTSLPVRAPLRHQTALYTPVHPFRFNFCHRWKCLGGGIEFTIQSS